MIQGYDPRTGQPGVTLDDFNAGLPALAQERFGPAGLVITYPDPGSLLTVLARLGGNLAAIPGCWARG